MYGISNSQRTELAILLAALEQLPATTIKNYNTKRRAKNAIAKLKKSKKL